MGNGADQVASLCFSMQVAGTVRNIAEEHFDTIACWRAAAIIYAIMEGFD